MPNSFGLWRADNLIGQVKLGIIMTYNICLLIFVSGLVLTSGIS